MNKNVLVLYHANCTDGFGAAYAAWVKFGNTATYKPVQYGEAAPDVTDREVYILDFSFKRDVLIEMHRVAKSLIVLDHHKTAQDDLEGLDFAIYDMKRSGAMIAWEYFHEMEAPYGIKLIQDRDLWKWDYPDTKPFTIALRYLTENDFEIWDKFLCPYNAVATRKVINDMIVKGNVIVKMQDTEVHSLARRAHAITLNGHTGLAVNTSNYVSEVGEVLALQSGTFGVCYFYHGEANQWIYSLRSKENFNASEIAKAFGGGGHEQSCGFKVPHPIGFNNYDHMKLRTQLPYDDLIELAVDEQFLLYIAEDEFVEIARAIEAKHEIPAPEALNNGVVRKTLSVALDDNDPKPTETVRLVITDVVSKVDSSKQSELV